MQIATQYQKSPQIQELRRTASSLETLLRVFLFYTILKIWMQFVQCLTSNQVCYEVGVSGRSIKIFSPEQGG